MRSPPRRDRRRQLVVMARWPAPGRCKRRLAAASGARRAAAIQARLTTHTLAAAQQLQPKWPVELVLAVDGLGGRAARRWGRTLGAARVRLQGRGSLGVRLQRQRQCARADGARAVVIVGSDLPELAAADLEAAFASLERVPLVLGPARDGGYWLIGLSGPALAAPAGPGATLFTGQDRAVAWGSGEVLAQTLAAAQAAGLGWRLLAERGDLDRPEDLEAWR